MLKRIPPLTTRLHRDLLPRLPPPLFHIAHFTRTQLSLREPAKAGLDRPGGFGFGDEGRTDFGDEVGEEFLLPGFAGGLGMLGGGDLGDGAFRLG